MIGNSCEHPDEIGNPKETWIELHSSADLDRVADVLFPKLAECRCPADDQTAIRTALEETIRHAFRYGAGNDPHGIVRLNLYVSDKYFIATIKDVGREFRRRAVPGITAHENPPYETGLFQVRRTMTWVRFNGIDNSVTMCKSWVGAKS
ncbi:MAG: ATP-binding protein [Planctomycetes bacterium]|nr:ATP-binding protein [Planctomycetota bacterium]